MYVLIYHLYLIFCIFLTFAILHKKNSLDYGPLSYYPHGDEIGSRCKSDQHRKEYTKPKFLSFIYFMSEYKNYSVKGAHEVKTTEKLVEPNKTD